MNSYRPNVAAIITRRDGSILICERYNVPDAWQFPQGGVDEGETPEIALHRECREEVGYKPRHYDIIGQKGPYRYDYPPDVLAKKLLKHPGYRGQEQHYFLCRLQNDAPEPVLDADEHIEFARYKWIQPAEFRLAWLPEFKKDVYIQVFKDFFNITLS